MTGKLASARTNSSSVVLLYWIGDHILRVSAEKRLHPVWIEQKLVLHQNDTHTSRSSSQAIALNNRTQELETVGANVSPKSIPSRCLNTLGFQQFLTDACVFRLVEEGRIVIIAVVHVDDKFAVGLKSRCDVFPC